MEMALFKKQPGIGLGQNATPEWRLPEGSTVSGKLNLEGSARIDGHLDGDITANDSVIIGESGMITGDVKAVSIIVVGTVKGDITGSERIEICPSAKVLGNLTAPQVLGQGAQYSEFAVTSKRARIWRVAVPGAAFAAIVATLLVAFLHDWRGNIAGESAKVATLRVKPGPGHPNALASSSDLITESSQRGPAPVAPNYTVQDARKDKSLAPGSARSVLPSMRIEAITSAAGRWTHASPLPVKPKVPRIAPIASVALGAVGATLGIVDAPPAIQVMPNTLRPNDISDNSSETATDFSSLDIDSNLHGTEGTIRAGTRITISNWQQYKAFMPDGMIALFSGKYGLKMPNDIEMNVGPPIHIVAPGSFRQASEKYSGEVRVVHLPNGRNDIANYVAGEPFPVPQGPDKGYEILADLWYTYSPHLAAGMPGAGLWNLTMLDRFGNATKATWAFVYRQLAFNTDPGVPRTDPHFPGAFYTQWLMTEEPEQAKYTTDLDILPQNAQQHELNYIFLPALRHPISFSVSSRCAPLLGTDWTHDDQKPGFNGGLANFDADYLRTMKMLALVNLSGAVSDFPREYDMPLGFARPSWGSWSLRDVWVINIHRIPSEVAGYCYAKRIEYIDEETARSLWEDLYDSNRNLWKVTLSAYYPRQVPGTDGETIYGRFAAATWDLQNQHATFGNSTDPSGRLIMFNAEVPREFDDVNQYSTPAGLMQIMR
jgi:hypothetical protein